MKNLSQKRLTLLDAVVGVESIEETQNDGRYLAVVSKKLDIIREAHIRPILSMYLDDRNVYRACTAHIEAGVNAIFHGNLDISSKIREDREEYRRRMLERNVDLIGKKMRFEAVAICTDETEEIDALHNVTYSNIFSDLETNEEAPTEPFSFHLATFYPRKCYVEAIEFRFSDEGNGFDPNALPDPTDMKNINSLSGRGVKLMRALMDDVHFNDQGNEVTMVKRIPKHTSE